MAWESAARFHQAQGNGANPPEEMKMPKTLARYAAMALAIGSVSTTVAEAAPTMIGDSSARGTRVFAGHGQTDQFIPSRHGADDPAGDDRRGRGRNDDPHRP